MIILLLGLLLSQDMIIPMIPEATLDLVEQSEGLILVASDDPTGTPTEGYGHTRDVYVGETITYEQAREYLRHDLFDAAYDVMRLTKVQLTSNQYAALIDFVYNTGEGTYEKSTLRKYINNKEFDKCPREFKRYIYSKGKILNGLITRRAREAKLFADK